MTIVTEPIQLESASRVPRRAGTATLVSIGTAVPQLWSTQDEFADFMARALNLKAGALEKWQRIINGSGIETRHAVARPEHVIDLTTRQRMVLYDQLAPSLAHQAGCRALEAASIRPGQITDLIVVSCTGFSAPGVDVALVQSLGLPPNVRRMTVGFMGCFGAISGLRAAIGACAANDNLPIALVVCIELCSLHIRADGDVQNQVASALFADGAAAAVVRRIQRTDSSHGHALNREGSQPIGLLNTGASMLIPQGRNWMTWRITDAGFAMTLAREVPTAIRARLHDFVSANAVRPRTCIVHPGGPGILDAVSAALGLNHEHGLQHSREILRRFGNMSSATVLFVLEEALRHRAPLPATLLAFGPGLSIESLQVLPLY